MESKLSSSIVVLSCSILFIIFCSSVSSDLSQDRAKCATDLAGLLTCLPYVSGDSKATSPPVDCCTGLKQVLKNSKECLCILVKDRNDPNLGIKIDATLALSLPDKCHAPANISECPALLHLPANSPEAKVFQDFAKGANGTKSSTATTPTPTVGAANSTAKGSSNSSDGGERRRWMIFEMFVGILFALLLNVQLVN